MQRADALTRKCGNAKEGIEQQFFPDGTIIHYDDVSPRMAQIMVLECSLDQSEAGEQASMTECGNEPDVELDVSFWERTDAGLLIPPNSINLPESGDVDPKLEVLCACHNSGMAGHWGRHRTQELVSWNF